MQATLAATNVSLNRADGKLRRFRNSHVCLNTFTDELLLRIFQHTSGYELEEKLNLLEVCWRWRDLCLSSPHFWTDFYARHYPRHAIPRAIRYSRGLPLHVVVNTVDEKKSRRVIFANAQSIESLRIMCAQMIGQRKNVWLDKTWPILREFDFSSDKLHENEDLVGAPFTGRVDKLRSLTLEHFRFPYSPQNYRNLRMLRLISVCYDNVHKSAGPHDGSFTDALRGSPNLEVLMLKEPPMSIDEVMLPREAVIQPVYLPRLRTIYLVTSTQKTTLLMRHFRTSATALRTAEIWPHRWRAETGPDPGMEYQALDLRPVENIDKTLMLELPCPECFPVLSRLQSLSIRDIDYHRVAGSLDALDSKYISWISRWNRSNARLTYTDDEEYTPPLTFNLEYRNSQATWYDADTLTPPAFDSFTRSLLRCHAPFTEMRVLRLDQVRYNYAYIRRLAPAMPRLRTVVLHKCDAQADVLNALLSGGPLPELTTLGLTRCTISMADAAKLAEALERLKLKVVVVRVRLGDVDEEWAQLEPVLRRGAVSVEIRYVKKWELGIDNDNGWWFRSEPYK